MFRSSDFQLNCAWETADGLVFIRKFGTFADIFIDASDPASPDLTASTESATLTETSFDASFELFEQSNEGEVTNPTGTGEASASLEATKERLNESFSFQNFKVHQTGQLFAVDGSLHLDTILGVTDLPMDGESCFAADADSPNTRALARDLMGSRSPTTRQMPPHLSQLGKACPS